MQYTKGIHPSDEHSYVLVKRVELVKANIWLAKMQSMLETAGIEWSKQSYDLLEIQAHFDDAITASRNRITKAS